MSSTFGTLFRVTTFGESHGLGVGAIVDGCPPALELSEADIQRQLDRRRPGQSPLVTPRDEPDRVSLLSGVEDGYTLGTPIGMVVRNRDQRPGDYTGMRAVPRPSHADYTYRMKYGKQASSGGGRSSARETIGRVAGGAVAEKWLRVACGVEIVAWVSAVGVVEAPQPQDHGWSRGEVDRHAVRCPDEDSAVRMTEAIEQARAEKDSLGGVVTCLVRGVPAGWGEPVFDKMEAQLARAMLSIPSVRGFDIGSGFAGARGRGSENNDLFVARGSGLGTATNRDGGVQGGISNGEAIYFRTAFKPPATIGRPQSTVAFDGEPVLFEAAGRHDPCVVPRAVPIVETMTALVLADMALRQRARSGSAR